MGALKLVKAEYTGHLVSFTEGAWFNATEAAAYFGKRVDHFLANEETRIYISALCEPDNTRDSGYYLKTKRGRNGGTWMHPDLAVVFARWLDIRFAIWCDRQIKQIISGSHPHYNWKKIRSEATSSFKVMTEVVRLVREEAGKATLAHHYSNEAKLINWALTGTFSGIDRNSLSATDLSMLANLETRNAVLVGRGLDYQSRKTVLREFAIDSRLSLNHSSQLQIGE